MRKQSAPGKAGGAWTQNARISGEGNIEVLREETVSGWKPVKTVVKYVQPSDGRAFYLEIDVFGVMDSKGAIANGLIYSLIAICPRCGPRAPKGSPMGQITLYAKDGIRMAFDENGKLHVERIKCPWLCGWAARINEGIAEDCSRSGLWSKISWNW